MMRNWLCVAAVVAAAFGCSEEAAKPTVEVVTNVGTMTIELWPQKAPLTVDNFLRLVDDGFYEGTVFHRVIANFMIQAGGYDAALNYREPPRTVANESSHGLKNVRWTVAMARHADPDSADAQFFVNMNDNAHLDEPPGYTVFGTLIGGHETAEDIELADAGVVGGRPDVPLRPIVILGVRRVPAGD